MPTRPSSTPHEQKAALRRTLLKARQALPQQIWQQKCDRLCQHLQNWPTFQRSRLTLAYYSFRNEPDLGSLFQQRLWGLPRSEGKTLVWHRWCPGVPLRRGAYGIPEPDPTAPLVHPDQVDLILLPAVACDIRGYRLGYGGGFYDRMLSQPAWASKPTIGIIFEYARLPEIPREPWDQRLTGICTESGLFLAEPSG